MDMLLGALLILTISLVVTLLFVYIRLVAVRWFLAVLIPYLCAALYYWSPVLLGGRDISEYGGWSLIFITVWYIPSYIASVTIVIRLRHHHNLAFIRQRSVAIPPIMGSQSISPKADTSTKLRALLGFILAAVVSGLLQTLGAQVPDMISGVFLAIPLVLLFGIPIYALFKAMGWLTFPRVLAGGTALGFLLAIFMFGMLGPELWDTWGRARSPAILLTGAMVIVQSIIVSGIFWLIAVAPITGWLRRVQKT